MDLEQAGLADTALQGELHIAPRPGRITDRDPVHAALQKPVFVAGCMEVMIEEAMAAVMGDMAEAERQLPVEGLGEQVLGHVLCEKEQELPGEPGLGLGAVPFRRGEIGRGEGWLLKPPADRRRHGRLGVAGGGVRHESRPRCEG